MQIKLFHFDYFRHYEYQKFYINVQLNPRYGFFNRVWLAVKYIFGARSRFGYGHWDEGGLDYNSAKNVRKLIDDFIFYCDTLRYNEFFSAVPIYSKRDWWCISRIFKIGWMCGKWAHQVDVKMDVDIH